jgi:4,5-dihydroxyphthalate decarboxylase
MAQRAAPGSRATAALIERGRRPMMRIGDPRHPSARHALKLAEDSRMPRVRLNFACGLYDRMLALYTSEVIPEGIDLNFIAIDDPRRIFDRMSAAQDFDVCEYSSSEFITRHAAGNSPFVAIPVFASRVFRNGHIWVNRRAVRTPKDLEGKRIGVALYTQTAAIYMRGLLEEDCGVDLSTVQWLQGAINSPGAHGNPRVLPLLRRVPIEQNRTGRSLSDLLADNEIQAILSTSTPDSRRRSADVVRLFPDTRAAEIDYYRRTRIFPIMHLIAIRRDVYERDRFIASSLYHAFERAKAIAWERMRDLGALRYMLPWLPADLDEIDAVFGGDCWPYGVEPNRPTLEAMVRFMVSQGLIAKPVPIEDLFVPVQG